MVVEGGYREVQGRTRLECERATMLFHPPGDEHADVISDLGSLCLHAVLEDSFLAGSPDADGRSLWAGRTRRPVPPQEAFRLRTTLRGRDGDARLEAEELLLALLGRMAGSRARAGMEIPRAPPGWLERVRERIHDELTGRYTLDDLARTASVHRVHLARAFRKHYGCTVGAYRRQRRVEAACRELVAGRAPLGRIALRVGFSDQSHFTNTFRRLVGTTPGAFRNCFGPDGRSQGAEPLHRHAG